MPPMTIDAETRELLGEVRTQLAEGNKLKAAVQQIEEQLKTLPQTIESKLSAIRRSIYDPRTGNWRGISFATEEEARGFGLYMLGCVGGDVRSLAAFKSEFKSIAQRALGDSPDADSLVPIEFSTRVDRLVEQFGVFARNAFTMPMTGDSLTFQRRKSGLTVFKTGRNTAAADSEQKFVTINLNATEWNTLTLFPKSLGEDAAPSIGEMIALDISQAFAEAIDNYGFTGDGTPDDLDVLGITAKLIAINGVDDGGGLVLASGNLWSEITEGDILKVFGQARYVRDGRVYCSNEFYWQVIAKLMMAKGGITLADFGNGPQLQAWGKPVEITPSLARSQGNSQVAMLYGDLRLSSTHGVRKQLTIEQDNSVKFIERQVAVLGTQRHAIENHTLGDATTAGPMVGLITAAG